MKLNYLLAIALGLAAASAAAQQKYVTVASAKSVEQAGLLQYVVPIFEKNTNIKVRVAALPTGDALDLARRDGADVVLAHDEDAESQFIAEGHGVERHLVMYNDFVLVGPKSDPAQVAGGKVIGDALQKIKAKGAEFVSHADNGGTHAAELRYWKAAGVEISTERGPWYRESGPGASALDTAISAGAYTIVDRGTWSAATNRGELGILVQRDPRLFNQYRVMLVNPKKHPRVKAKDGRAFIDWLVSKQGQHAIASYRIKGQILFFPNARRLDS